jgi:hypothetical protein
MKDLKAASRKLFISNHHADKSIKPSCRKENDKENEIRMLPKPLCKNDDQSNKLIRKTSFGSGEQKKRNKSNVTKCKSSLENKSAHSLASTCTMNVTNSHSEKSACLVQSIEGQMSQPILPPESVTVENYCEGQKLVLLTNEDIENILTLSTLPQSPKIGQLTSLLQDNLQTELEEMDFYEECEYGDSSSKHSVSNALHSVHSVLYYNDGHQEEHEADNLNGVLIHRDDTRMLYHVTDRNEVKFNVSMQVNESNIPQEAAGKNLAKNNPLHVADNRSPHNADCRSDILIYIDDNGPCNVAAGNVTKDLLIQRNEDTGLQVAEAVNSTDEDEMQINENAGVRNDEIENEESISIQVTDNRKLRTDEGNKAVENTNSENRKSQEAADKNFADSIPLNVTENRTPHDDECRNDVLMYVDDNGPCNAAAGNVTKDVLIQRNEDTGLQVAKDVNNADGDKMQINENTAIRDVEVENEVENIDVQVNDNKKLHTDEGNRTAENKTDKENRKPQNGEDRSDPFNMHIDNNRSHDVTQINEYIENMDADGGNDIENVQNLIQVIENRMPQANEGHEAENDPILFRRKQRKPGAVVKRLQRKQNRLTGVAYETVKEKHATARSMKARCGHNTVKSRCSFYCSKVSDNVRENYYKQFWLLPTWDAKKAFITGLCTTRFKAIRRRKSTSTENNKPKKSFHDCFLLCDDSTMVKVCCKLFTNTFDITSRQLLRWLSNKTAVLPDKPAKQYTQKQESVVEWVETLPKVPSHYCRATTSRMYVESTFRSISHMYSIYSEYAKKRGEKPLCRQLFANVLEDKKVSIHIPRKDQCDLCCSHKAGITAPDDYEEHIIKKDEARIAKNAAKEKCDNNTVVITMDVQSVLLAPKLMASALYYKRKLQLHNMTFYRLTDGEVHLYVWDESEGGVTSNEFTSCIVHYISALPENVKHIIIISDGCAYQNRNRVLSSALRDISRSQDRVIEQLILEKGHTMMEVDSVHAQLDRLFKHAVIYAPSDYVCIMQQARPQQPFNVKILDHTFFVNYESLATNVLTIRPGFRAGEATVTDIRALR